MFFSLPCNSCIDFTPHIDNANGEEYGKLALTIPRKKDNCVKWLCNAGGCPFEEDIKAIKTKVVGRRN